CSRVRHLQPGNNTKQSRLAGTGRTQQRDKFPRRAHDGHVVQRDEVAEPLRHVLRSNRHGRISPQRHKDRTKGHEEDTRRVFNDQFSCLSSLWSFVAPSCLCGESSFFLPSTQTFSSSVTTASIVNTEASANAAGLLKSWNSTSTCSGIVLVSPAMRPDTT